MEEIKIKIQQIKKQLSASDKERLICVSTTANLHNPKIFIGGIRETPTTIAGNIILRDLAIVDYVVEEFDGFVEYFLIDCEIKNEVTNLESCILPKITKSKVFVYKPNDFAVESLDILIANIFVSLSKINVLVLGAGNLGSKISLKLCERGGDVMLLDRDQKKLVSIVSGLNNIKRSNTFIKEALLIEKLSQDFDLIIGCTPGVPAITINLISLLKEGGVIIDAGNGTLTPEAIKLAAEKNIEIICLSSMPGYSGMIENWLLQRKFTQSKRFIKIGNHRIIIPGVFGNKGDVLVDSIEKPTKIIGMCDGLGDILGIQESNILFKNFFNELGKEKYVLELKNLYDKM